MPWFHCHTHVVFQITNVLFFNFTSSSHTLMIVNPLLIYLNTNICLTMPNLDMISLKGLTSAALSFHFMINCHYLALSPIQSWIYFFEGGLNNQGHHRMWEKQTTNICSPKKRTLQTFVVWKSGHYKAFVVWKSGHYKTFVVSKSSHYKTFVVLKSGHYKTFVVSKSGHYKLL